MKINLENLKKKYYARKMYKAIKYVACVVGNPMYTINGSEHTCYINKKRLGKNFNNTKYESWLAQLMKEKYGLRFLKCNNYLDIYYKISFYKK